MGYKILEGFSLELSNFSPQNGCLFSPGLNIFYCSSVFSSFSQVFSLVLEGLEVVGPEALYLFTLPLGMQVLAQFMMLLVMTLPILSGFCEKSILSWCGFLSSISVKLLQLAFLKFQEVLIYGSSILCRWVRVTLAITGLCPDPGYSSMMRFVFALMSLDTSRRSGVVWVPLKWRYVDGSVSLYNSSRTEVLSRSSISLPAVLVSL